MAGKFFTTKGDKDTPKSPLPSPDIGLVVVQVDGGPALKTSMPMSWNAWTPAKVGSDHGYPSVQWFDARGAAWAAKVRPGALQEMNAQGVKAQGLPMNLAQYKEKKNYLSGGRR